MSFIKQNLRSILIFAGVIFVVYFGYSYLFPADQGTPIAPAGLATAPPGQGDLLPLLLNLRSLKLDPAVFSDPSFRSLVNFGIEIPVEPIGRTNPFAPLSGGSLPGGPNLSIGSAKK